MSEEELAILVAAGDDQAFAELAVRLKRQVRAIAAQFFAAGLERDDLVQASLFGLWRACCTYDPTVCDGAGNFTGFAGMCMRRNLISAVKAAQRGKHSSLNDAISFDSSTRRDLDVDSLYEVFASPEQGPLESLLTGEQLEAVVEAFAGFSEIERESVVGFLNGESYIETEARILGLTTVDASYGRAKVVDNALQRARVKVIRALGEDVRRRPLGVAA